MARRKRQLFLLAAMENILRRGLFLCKFACSVHLINTHILEITYCTGPSMLPTFNIRGDWLLVDHFSIKLKKVQPGDVVTCISPTDPSKVICKRIVGVEGDRVKVDPTKRNSLTIEIPKGHVWLCGDNLNNSTDSRHYGPVPAALLRGKVRYRVWPLWNEVTNGMRVLTSMRSTN